MTGVSRKNTLKEGVKINNYTVIRRVGVFEGKSDERAMWEVECKCGLRKIKINRYIRRSLNCGSDCGLKKVNQ